MLAIFVSGNGSTLQTMIDCQKMYDYNISVVVANRSCFAIERAQRHALPTLISQDWHDIDLVIQKNNVKLIVLAGFLAIIPQWFCEKWDGMIVNIHPSLLPKFGGKGMYGSRVHEAVLAAGEKQSGCTIHYVSAEVDGGKIIAQSLVPILVGDTPDTLGRRVQQAEKQLLPRVISDLLKQ